MHNCSLNNKFYKLIDGNKFKKKIFIFSDFNYIEII